MEQPILRGAAIDLHGEQPEVHGAGQYTHTACTYGMNCYHAIFKEGKFSQGGKQSEAGEMKIFFEILLLAMELHSA